MSTRSFIILRYSGLLSTIPMLLFTSTPLGNCAVAARLNNVGAVLVVVCSNALFAIRVFTIWGGNRVVHAVVGFFFLLVLATRVSSMHSHPCRWRLVIDSDGLLHR